MHGCSITGALTIFPSPIPGQARPTPHCRSLKGMVSPFLSFQVALDGRGRLLVALRQHLSFESSRSPPRRRWLQILVRQPLEAHEGSITAPHPVSRWTPRRAAFSMLCLPIMGFIEGEERPRFTAILHSDYWAASEAIIMFSFAPESGPQEKANSLNPGFLSPRSSPSSDSWTIALRSGVPVCRILAFAAMYSS